KSQSFLHRNTANIQCRYTKTFTSTSGGGMARRKSEKPSTSSMFKAIFAAHPELLKIPSLDGVMELFHQAHPDISPAPNLRQTAANIKSTLKRKKGVKGARRGRPPGVAIMNGTPVAKPAQTLERLEDRIDDCIAL